MGIIELITYRVSCDYPGHEGKTLLGPTEEFHRLEGGRIICSDCWDDEMSTDDLLQFLRISHRVQCVGDEDLNEV